MAIYKEDIVSIELSNGTIHRSFLNHSIGTGDNSANRFGIRVFRNGSEVDLSGASCQAYFKNAEGTNIALTSYGTVSGNVAYVTLPQACYNVEGQFCLAIKLIGGGVTGTMRIIDGMVCNTGTTGAVAPTSSVPTYQEILSTYEAMVSATSAANLAIAETFDASKDYPAGKNVINDGALYVLPNGHTAGTTWANTTKVTSNLGDQVSDLNRALAIKTDTDGYEVLHDYPMSLGNTAYAIWFSDTNLYASYLIDVKPSDVFRIVGGSSPTSIAFLTQKPLTQGQYAFSSQSGYTGKWNVSAGAVAQTVIPSDVSCVWILTKNNGTSVKPADVLLNGFSYEKSIREYFEEVLPCVKFLQYEQGDVFADVLQKAISNSDCIYIPSGTYTLTKSVNITKSCKIIGIGDVVINMPLVSNNEDPSSLIMSYYSSFKASEINNICIENITLRGEYDYDTYGYQDPWETCSHSESPLFFRQCKNIVLKDVTIEKFFSCLGSDADDWYDRDENGLVHNMAYLTNCENILIDGFRNINCTGESFSIYNSKNVRVVNSDFSYSEGTSLLDITYCNGVLVNNCTIAKNVDFGHGNGFNLVGKNVFIVGNVFKNISYDIGGNEYINRNVPEFYNYLNEQITIRNNTFVNSIYYCGIPNYNASQNIPLNMLIQKNITISDNEYIFDFGTAIDGFDFLDNTAYCTIYMSPKYYSSRNIVIKNNNISMGGEYQNYGYRFSCITLEKKYVVNYDYDTNGHPQTHGFTITGNNVSFTGGILSSSQYSDYFLYNSFVSVLGFEDEFDTFEITGNSVKLPMLCCFKAVRKINNWKICDNIANSENFIWIMQSGYGNEFFDLFIQGNKFRHFHFTADTLVYTLAETDGSGCGVFLSAPMRSNMKIINLNVLSNVMQCPMFIYSSNTLGASAQSNIVFGGAWNIIDNEFEEYVGTSDVTDGCGIIRIGKDVPELTGNYDLIFINNTIQTKASYVIYDWMYGYSNLKFSGNKFYQYTRIVLGAKYNIRNYNNYYYGNNLDGIKNGSMSGYSLNTDLYFDNTVTKVGNESNA